MLETLYPYLIGFACGAVTMTIWYFISWTRSKTRYAFEDIDSDDFAERNDEINTDLIEAYAADPLSARCRTNLCVAIDTYIEEISQKNNSKWNHTREPGFIRYFLDDIIFGTYRDLDFTMRYQIRALRSSLLRSPIIERLNNEKQGLADDLRQEAVDESQIQQRLERITQLEGVYGEIVDKYFQSEH